ncbi:MAG: hypothetical protein WC401_00290 [Bacteroidales bacterium]|jgi:hypothetical protein|nr:hypothetical protein [Bacteroidales bacterium]
MAPARSSVKLVVIILLYFAVSSCALFDVSRSKNPKKVANRFLKHFYNQEYDKAKIYGTTKTRQIVDFMDQLQAVSGQDKLPMDTKVVLLDCEQKGDTAYCNYLANNIKNELLLIKVYDKWLVDLKKEAKVPKDKTKMVNDFLKHQKTDDSKK